MNKTGHSGPIVFLEVDLREEQFLEGLCPPDWPARSYRDEADRIDLEKIQDAEVLSVFIYSDLDAALLGRLPHLKAISTGSMVEQVLTTTVGNISSYLKGSPKNRIA